MVKNYMLLVLLSVLNVLTAQTNLDIFDLARKGTVQEMQQFLKLNPKAIDVVNKDGNSPLVLACYKSNNEVAKFLIQSGANSNIKNPMGTALMACVVKGNIEIAKILIDNKADVNATDANGTSPIIYASMFKNYELATLLIKAKANPELKDNRNNSAVDYAFLANDDKLLQILKTK